MPPPPLLTPPTPLALFLSLLRRALLVAVSVASLNGPCMPIHPPLPSSCARRLPSSVSILPFSLLLPPPFSLALDCTPPHGYMSCAPPTGLLHNALPLHHSLFTQWPDARAAHCLCLPESATHAFTCRRQMYSSSVRRSVSHYNNSNTNSISNSPTAINSAQARARALPQLAMAHGRE